MCRHISKNTHISTQPVFCSRVFGVLSVLLEWQNHFMPTGEHSFMQTLDWCQLDWQGMNARKGKKKKKLGASHPTEPRCRHIKERSEAFRYGGKDRRTSFSPDTSPQCAFVDCCLVFPRRAPHKRLSSRTGWQNNAFGVSRRDSWKKNGESKQKSRVRCFAGACNSGSPYPTECRQICRDDASSAPLSGSALLKGFSHLILSESDGK